MSFTDPLSITIAASTMSLPKTGTGEHSSEYTTGDGLVVVSASHDVGKRQRHVLRIDTSKLAPDAFRPAENEVVSMSHYVVFDMPVNGYSDAEALDVYKGFQSLYSSSSHAMIAKLLGGES